MTPEEVRDAIEGLEATLRLIDAGEIDSTPVQRAYIAGTVNGLRASDGDGGGEVGG